jgi:hypothetical protein
VIGDGVRPARLAFDQGTESREEVLVLEDQGAFILELGGTRFEPVRLAPHPPGQPRPAREIPGRRDRRTRGRRSGCGRESLQRLLDVVERRAQVSALVPARRARLTVTRAPAYPRAQVHQIQVLQGPQDVVESIPRPEDTDLRHRQDHGPPPSLSKRSTTRRAAACTRGSSTRRSATWSRAAVTISAATRSRSAARSLPPSGCRGQLGVDGRLALGRGIARLLHHRGGLLPRLLQQVVQAPLRLDQTLQLHAAPPTIRRSLSLSHGGINHREGSIKVPSRGLSVV